jgi:hypothetical protein
MGQRTTKRLREKQWRDRAEEMLTLAQTMRQEETRAQMERLAADWLLIAAVEDERQRPARESGDSRHGDDGAV